MILNFLNIHFIMKKTNETITIINGLLGLKKEKIINLFNLNKFIKLII